MQIMKRKATMEHSFDIDLATKIGLKPAIILKHISFWVRKNEANNKHFYDGRYWTYCSVKGFQKIFPYLGTKEIRNALVRLSELKYIQTGNYNTKGYDKTLWYSVSQSLYPKGQMDYAKRANGLHLLGEPIPDTITDTITDILTDNKKESIDVLEYLPSAFSEHDKFTEVWAEFLQYRKERRIAPYKLTGLKTLAKSKLSVWGVEGSIQSIQNSISNNYQGLFPPKQLNQKRNFNYVKTQKPATSDAEHSRGF